MRLLKVVITLAIVGTLGRLVVAWRLGAWFDPAAFATAVVAFAGTQLLRLRVRVGTEDISFGWVEVGLITVLCLVAPVWTPAAVFLGSVLALGPQLPTARPEVRRAMLFFIATIVASTAAASGAAALVSVLTGPVEVVLNEPVRLVPLAVAGLVQFVFGTALTAGWLAAPTRTGIWTAWRLLARAKRTIMAGTAVVSLAAAVLVSVSAVWLLVLAPVLWILHRTYEHQLRAGQERATWATLAEVTRALNQLDERGVVLAALRGAARLFQPELVEVILVRPWGTRRLYRARAGDALAGDVSIVDGAVDAPTPDRRTVARRLTVGNVGVGEIRLYLRPAAGFAESDQHAFSTFAEAAASALHDAATHRTLRAMTERSAYDALYDSLTGLPNRSTLVARANAELRKGPRRAPVALILIDVDGLRDVNDALGYSAGDEVLQGVARRLRERHADGGLIGRLGGDEFAIVMLGAPDTATDTGAGPDDGYAVELARMLRADLAVPADVGGVTIAVEVTMGVVEATAAAGDMGELLRRADVALQQAKLEPGRLARYDPSRDAAKTDRPALLADLRDALGTTDQFVLHVQPAIDLATGRPISVEALSRWEHPQRGRLEPAEYIGVVEHSDLAGSFTLHVLDLALGLSARWAGQGLHLPISVNLCARCTSNPELPMLVADRLAAHGVPPDRLVLEITESVAMAEADLAEQVVAGLRQLGVGVCVDDFGTGSASLSFLARFPVDEVKIDRTFVATMVDSPETAAIVRATVDLAHDLGMRVVAEGVERSEQRAALLGLGVGAAQGFLFHPPMSIEEATLLLLGRPEAIPVASGPPPERAAV